MKTFKNSFRVSRLLFAALPILSMTPLATGAALRTLQTRYATISIDERGFITSLVSRASGKEYCPTVHGAPGSSLLSLHESGQPNDRLVQPTSAADRGDKGEIELTYPNGAKAIVKIAAKEDYFRFQLVSLDPRGRSEKETVDNIVWGPLNTTIRGTIGDLIGVVRDPDWAIGMYGLDDNTIAGPVVDSDCYCMGY